MRTEKVEDSPKVNPELIAGAKIQFHSVLCPQPTNMILNIGNFQKRVTVLVNIQRFQLTKR